MPCFIDNPNVDEEYKGYCFLLMPNIKTSRYCKRCLSNHKEEVEPVDCPVFIEWDKEKVKGVVEENLKLAKSGG